MKYEYIDEYGAYGFEFSDPGCTAHYMDTLLDIVKGYRDNQKDDFLAISVIQTCIDVYGNPKVYHLVIEKCTTSQSLAKLHLIQQTSK